MMCIPDLTCWPGTALYHVTFPTRIYCRILNPLNPWPDNEVQNEYIN